MKNLKKLIRTCALVAHVETYSMEPFAERTKQVISFAREEADRGGEWYLSPEHLLIGILREGEGPAAQILSRLGLNLERTRQELEPKPEEDRTPKGKALEREYAKAHAQELGLGYVSLADTPPSPDALALVPAEVAKRHQLVPFLRNEGHLLVATANPEKTEVVSELQSVSGCRVILAVAAPRDVSQALATAYSGEA